MVKQVQCGADVSENFLSGSVPQHPVIEVPQDVDSLSRDICSNHDRAPGENSGSRREAKRQDRVLVMASPVTKQKNFL